MLETMRTVLRLIYVKPERVISQKLCNGLHLSVLLGVVRISRQPLQPALLDLDQGRRRCALQARWVTGPAAICRSKIMSTMPAAATTSQPGAKYDHLIAAAKRVPTVSTIVVHPCDESSLRGAIESAEADIIKATLVGPAARIRDVAAKNDLNISGCEIVDT